LRFDGDGPRARARAQVRQLAVVVEDRRGLGAHKAYPSQLNWAACAWCTSGTVPVHTRRILLLCLIHGVPFPAQVEDYRWHSIMILDYYKREAQPQPRRLISRPNFPTRLTTEHTLYRNAHVDVSRADREEGGWSEALRGAYTLSRSWLGGCCLNNWVNLCKSGALPHRICADFSTRSAALCRPFSRASPPCAQRHARSSTDSPACA